MRRNSLASQSGFAIPGPAGMLELIENHDFSGAATSFTFSGLDGDTDEVYLLLYKIVKNTASTMVTSLRPNGVTTNQLTAYSYGGLVGGGAVSGGTSVAALAIGSNGLGNGAVEVGLVYLSAKTGTRRLGHGEWSQSEGADNLLYLRNALHWTDTATNITSIDVVADVASGIGAGSYARLYKLLKA